MVGIVYGALVALAQSDIKRLVAYSSVSHMGFCMLGLFALNPLGIQGGVLQMVNHGLATGGLFAIVGMIYERYHTRAIADLGGLARRTPRLACFMLLMTLSSIGLPGLGGFVGEFLILLGMFQRAWTAAPPAGRCRCRVISVLAVSGVVLGAWYMLGLVRRVFFGPLREPKRDPAEPPVADLSAREVMALAPLAVFIVWIGLQPSFFLDRMSPTLDRLTGEAQRDGTPEDEGRGESANHALASERPRWPSAPSASICVTAASFRTRNRSDEDQTVTTETLHLLMPEIVLAIAAVTIYVAGAFVASRAVWSWIGLGAIAIAAAAMLSPAAATRRSRWPAMPWGN